MGEDCSDMIGCQDLAFIESVGVRKRYEWMQVLSSCGLEDLEGFDL